MDNKIAFSVTEAAAQLGISRPAFYRLMKQEKDFPCYKVGTRTLIDVESLKAWSARQAQGGENHKQRD